MSDTLLNIIKDNLKTYPIVTDNEGMIKDRFEIKYHPDKFLIDEEDNVDQIIINEIISNYDKGLTQFIICNTIHRSKVIRSALKNENVILYNSEFVNKDKIQKEKDIYEAIGNKKPFILIAT